MTWRLVVSCEHGGHDVPARWRCCFRGRAALLRSHRGWDPGALVLARTMARRFGVPAIATTTTRLLVDTNRSAGHPQRFSEATRGLPASERARIVAEHWAPHRARVETSVEAAMQGRALAMHVACHSFTPVLDGVARHTDVGLLFDPRRSHEAAVARAWQTALRARIPGLRVHRNRPYRGVADGLPTAFRRLHVDGRYAGIELEVSQALLRDARRWGLVTRVLAATLLEALRATIGAPARTSRR